MALYTKDTTQCQRLHSSSVLGLPYRVLSINQKKGTTMEPMGRANTDMRRDREELCSNIVKADCADGTTGT